MYPAASSLFAFALLGAAELGGLYFQATRSNAKSCRQGARRSQHVAILSLATFILQVSRGCARSLDRLFRVPGQFPFAVWRTPGAALTLPAAPCLEGKPAAPYSAGRTRERWQFRDIWNIRPASRFTKFRVNRDPHLRVPHGESRSGSSESKTQDGTRTRSYAASRRALLTPAAAASATFRGLPRLDYLRILASRPCGCFLSIRLRSKMTATISPTTPASTLRAVICATSPPF